MTTSTPTSRSSAQRRARLRAQMEERLHHQRQQPLPAWLATTTTRRCPALVPVATFALGVVAAVTGGGFSSALLLGATSLAPARARARGAGR